VSTPLGDVAFATERSIASWADMSDGLACAERPSLWPAVHGLVLTPSPSFGTSVLMRGYAFPRSIAIVPCGELAVGVDGGHEMPEGVLAVGAERLSVVVSSFCSTLNPARVGPTSFDPIVGRDWLIQEGQECVVSSESDAMEEGVRALSRFFVDEGTLGDTLLRVAEMACAVAPADMAGITLLVDGKPETGVFTDPEAPEIDRAQYETGQGPCLDAFRDQQIYRIDSTADETRWPAFTKDAANHGICCTLSVPVSARGEGLGALNLFSRSRAFDDESARRVEVFANQAAIVLANAQVYWDSRQLSENLNEAMRSRATIDHAVGIILATGGRTPDDAFQTLVRASQRENRKLREIAEEVVQRAVARTKGGPTGAS